MPHVEAKRRAENGKVVEIPASTFPIKVEPPQKKRKRFPFQGFIDFQGLKIDVENKAGSVRRGMEKNGHHWATKMHFPYGEIRGTEGADNDALDVYVGPNHDASLVLVVHQHKPLSDGRPGEYDEDKCMLGFDTEAAAIAAYKQQYDRPGFYQEGDYTAMPIGAFWRWVHDGRKRGKKVTLDSAQTIDDQSQAARAGFTEADPAELKRGIAEEMREHNLSQEEAKRVALDHLSKDRAYYSHLERMEREQQGGGMKIGRVKVIG